MGCRWGEREEGREGGRDRWLILRRPFGTSFGM